MPGLERDTPVPTEITLDKKRRVLVLGYGETMHELTFELLRVYSPSAEVRGHGPGQEVLQVGKRNVDIDELEPVGMYAIRPTFSDGHNSGIYSWDYLHKLCADKENAWNDYLGRIEKAGASRD
ncbi:MAG: gamma-butyrobetaine hydroxylase-like domain-containing protein [Casimicrobium sp.]